MKLHNIATLILILVIFALPFAVHAQDDSLPIGSELPPWAAGLPSVLVQMVSLNIVGTEVIKRWLANPALPFTPSERTRGLLVILASFVIGVASAFMYPESLSYVSDSVHIALKYLFVGVSVSVLGGFVYDLKSRLSNGKAVYTTTTSVSTPSSDTSASVAKDTLAVAAQVAGNEAKG